MTHILAPCRSSVWCTTRSPVDAEAVVVVAVVAVIPMAQSAGSESEPRKERAVPTLKRCRDKARDAAAEGGARCRARTQL